MRQYRFFVSADQIHGQRLVITGGQARQIYSVLRMRESERIIVLDNLGRQYDVRLDKVSSDLVMGEVLSREVALGEPRVDLTLYQALLKKDNFEWVLQKGTELGVARFVPFISQRCVVRQNTIKPAKLQRWQRIISEAAEQSGRGRLPELSAPVLLPEAVEQAGAFDRAIIPWEEEKASGLRQVLEVDAGERPLPSRIALFIGPEGGFDEEEIEIARDAGVHPVTLGPRILRAETAAVAAVTMVLSALGEME
jgi:16S rRNA (uracil1498-N3)-methyltransferase